MRAGTRYFLENSVSDTHSLEMGKTQALRNPSVADVCLGVFGVTATHL